MQSLERLLVYGAVRPIIARFARFFRISLSNLYVYCIFASLLFVVPTGLKLTELGGTMPQLLLSATLLVVVAYIASMRPRLKTSSPIWRGFLCLMIARNLMGVASRDAQPYSLLMWSFMLIAEYVCIVDEIDRNSRQE